MLRLARYTLILLGSTALVGCAQMGGGGSSAQSTTAAPTDTQLAAYAASHPYPSTMASEDIKVAALGAPDRTQLKLYNFSNKPLSDVDVWVNSGWVQHVDGISANGSVIVKTSDLYDAFGHNFASQKEPFSRVQLKTGNSLYNAMGPVAQ